MSKTLGQIAYDAAGEKLGSYPGIGEWEHLPEYGKLYWQAAANAIIEECAKVAFTAGCGKPDCTDCIGGGVAAAIRALKSPETDAGEATQ